METPAHLTRETPAHSMAYQNINTTLWIEGSLSRTKLAKLAILATKHVFLLLQPEGIDRLPRNFATAEETLNKAREIGDDFVRVYGGRLWPGRSLSEEGMELFHQCIRNFITSIFSLIVTSSEVSDDDPEELIEEFRTAEPDDFDIIRPTTLDELAEYIRLKKLPADLEAGGEPVNCRNCGEEMTNIGYLYVHFSICLANYRIEASKDGSEGVQDAAAQKPSFVKWPKPPEPEPEP